METQRSVWVLQIQIPNSGTEVWLFDSEEKCTRKYREVVMFYFYEKLGGDRVKQYLGEAKDADETFDFDLEADAIEDFETLMRVLHHVENGEWVLDKDKYTTDQLFCIALEEYAIEDCNYGRWKVDIYESSVM